MSGESVLNTFEAFTIAFLGEFSVSVPGDFRHISEVPLTLQVSYTASGRTRPALRANTSPDVPLILV